VPIEQLPAMDWNDYIHQATDSRLLNLVARIVHDLSKFVNGDEAMTKSGIGKICVDL